VKPLESHDPEGIGRYRLRGRLGAGGSAAVVGAVALSTVSIFNGGLAVAGSVLVTLASEGSEARRGLDIATGAERWAVPDDVPPSSRLVTTDGAIYVQLARTSSFAASAYDARPASDAGCTKETRAAVPPMSR